MKIVTALHTGRYRAVRAACLPAYRDDDGLWFLKTKTRNSFVSARDFVARIDNNMFVDGLARVVGQGEPFGSKGHVEHTVAIANAAVRLERTEHEYGCKVLSRELARPDGTLMIYFPGDEIRLMQIEDKNGITVLDVPRCYPELMTQRVHRHLISPDLVAIEAGQTVLVSPGGTGDLGHWAWDGKSLTVNGKPAMEDEILWA